MEVDGQRELDTHGSDDLVAGVLNFDLLYA